MEGQQTNAASGKKSGGKQANSLAGMKIIPTGKGVGAGEEEEAGSAMADET